MAQIDAVQLSHKLGGVQIGTEMSERARLSDGLRQQIAPLGFHFRNLVAHGTFNVESSMKASMWVVSSIGTKRAGM